MKLSLAIQKLGIKVGIKRKMAVRKNISSKSNQGCRELVWFNGDDSQLTQTQKNGIILELRIDFQLS